MSRKNWTENRKLKTEELETYFVQKPIRFLLILIYTDILYTDTSLQS